MNKKIKIRVDITGKRNLYAIEETIYSDKISYPLTIITVGDRV